MHATETHFPPLAEYVSLADIQQRLGHFPTIESFRWFARQHRDQLAACGALILVAGRQKFHPGLTEQVVIEVGRHAAARASGSSVVPFRRTGAPADAEVIQE